MDIFGHHFEDRCVVDKSLTASASVDAITSMTSVAVCLFGEVTRKDDRRQITVLKQLPGQG